MDLEWLPFTSAGLTPARSSSPPACGPVQLPLSRFGSPTWRPDTRWPNLSLTARGACGSSLTRERLRSRSNDMVDAHGLAFTADRSDLEGPCNGAPGPTVIAPHCARSERVRRLDAPACAASPAGYIPVPSRAGQSGSVRRTARGRHGRCCASERQEGR